jgi:2-C-methyl-D-erythritol 2,4-cyclodiphosphate synthase
MNFRTGQGIDFHRIESDLELWLGGIKIPSEKGSVAYSDGDVLLHAMCDALLGAACLGDIGHHFPDTDPVYKNIDSKILLKKTFDLIKEKGFSIINIDSTVCIERPKIAVYIPKMQSMIAGILETAPDNISIKATTTEKMGFVGKGKGIVAIATVLLQQD